jgi:hypothetical protein
MPHSGRDTLPLSHARRRRQTQPGDGMGSGIGSMYRPTSQGLRRWPPTLPQSMAGPVRDVIKIT